MVTEVVSFFEVPKGLTFFCFFFLIFSLLNVVLERMNHRIDQVVLKFVIVNFLFFNWAFFFAVLIYCAGAKNFFLWKSAVLLFICL